MIMSLSLGIKEFNELTKGISGINAKGSFSLPKENIQVPILDHKNPNSSVQKYLSVF